MTGVVVLCAAVSLAGIVGFWRSLFDGRFRTPRWLSRERTPAQPSGPLAGTAWAGTLGARATLVQFSSAFCAPCRATRQVLGEVAGMVPGVRHVEIDAESALDLVRSLDVRRTPTTRVVDDAGRVVERAAGQPRKADVIAAVGRALP